MLQKTSHPNNPSMDVEAVDANFNMTLSNLRKKGVDVRKIEIIYVITGITSNPAVIKFGRTSKIAQRMQQYNNDRATYFRDTTAEPKLAELRYIRMCTQPTRAETLLRSRLASFRHRDTDLEWVTCPLAQVIDTINAILRPVNLGGESLALPLYEPIDTRKRKRISISPVCNTVDALLSTNTSATAVTDEEKYIQMVLSKDVKQSAMESEPWKFQMLREVLSLFRHAETRYNVHLEVVSRLLQRPGGNVKRLLKKSFIEDTDYIIQPKLSTGGRPAEFVRLTTNAFKRLALMLRGKRADALRGYFIVVEDAYRQGQLKKIAKCRRIDGKDLVLHQSRDNMEPGPAEEKALASCV